MVEQGASFFETIVQLQNGDQSGYESLLAIKNRYPYFQHAWLYLAKWAEKHQPEEAEALMQQTACRTFDRSLLFDWHENPLKQQEKAKVKPKKKTKVQQTPPKKVKKVTPTPKPQKESAPPQMTFTNWLQFVQANPQKATPPNDRFALIDAFLAQQPKIQPPLKGRQKQEDLSEASWTSTDELMTETLAKIFVKQKKYTKALQAYEILRLKYPEKNSFFANQIKAIKELQENK